VRGAGTAHARISAEAEAARAAAALFVDREAAERTVACASLWHAAEQREAERVVRDAVAATVEAMGPGLGRREPRGARGDPRHARRPRVAPGRDGLAHAEATAMGLEDAAAASAASAAAARAHKDVRAAVESLAAEVSEAHAAVKRDRIERDLARLAGELGAADARSIARNAALHGEVEDEARARCARLTPRPRPR